MRAAVAHNLEKKTTMKAAKSKKPEKTKNSALRVKDLRPRKDARGGAQKKEDPENQVLRASF